MSGQINWLLLHCVLSRRAAAVNWKRIDTSQYPGNRGFRQAFTKRTQLILHLSCFPRVWNCEQSRSNIRYLYRIVNHRARTLYWVMSWLVGAAMKKTSGDETFPELHIWGLSDVQFILIRCHVRGSVKINWELIIFLKSGNCMLHSIKIIFPGSYSLFFFCGNERIPVVKQRKMMSCTTPFAAAQGSFKSVY